MEIYPHYPEEYSCGAKNGGPADLSEYWLVNYDLADDDAQPFDGRPGKGAGPLKKIHVPASKEIAMMMSIALRFIPILMEETDKLKASSLGQIAQFESGNVFPRGRKALFPCLNLYLYPLPSGPIAWLWLWKRAAITAGEGGRNRSRSDITERLYGYMC